MNEDLRGELAALLHELWGGWMEYLFSLCPTLASGAVEIPVSLVARWKRQVATAFADLSAAEQASDRAEADRVLALLGTHAAAHRPRD